MDNRRLIEEELSELHKRRQYLMKKYKDESITVAELKRLKDILLEISLIDIEVAIEKWHSSPSTGSLHAYLGWSEKKYKFYVEDLKGFTEQLAKEVIARELTPKSGR